MTQPNWLQTPHPRLQRRDRHGFSPCSGMPARRVLQESHPFNRPDSKTNVKIYVQACVRMQEFHFLFDRPLSGVHRFDSTGNVEKTSEVLEGRKSGVQEVRVLPACVNSGSCRTKVECTHQNVIPATTSFPPQRHSAPQRHSYKAPDAWKTRLPDEPRKGVGQHRPDPLILVVVPRGLEPLSPA